MKAQPWMLAACLACSTAFAAPPAARVPKSAGNLVLQAQLRLDRAHFSPGEIDGAMGANMKRAIQGFQAANDLPVSGRLDAATLAALDMQSTPALAKYTLQQADVAGPFQEVPEAMADKAKLPKLGYASALEGLAEKFHASPQLLKKLNPGLDFSQAGLEIVVPNVSDEKLPKAAQVVVDKSDRTVSLFDSAGKVIAQFPASMGSEHDPLPLGQWKVRSIVRNPVFHYNPDLFWDADPGDTRVQVPAGPNNPVGVVWIDLSKDHYGIHGTPEPATVGKTQSHGCVRLTNWDAALLAQSVAPGTEVLMQE